MAEPVLLREALQRPESCLPPRNPSETPPADPSAVLLPLESPAHEPCPVCQDGAWLWDRRLKQLVPCEACGAVMAIRREYLAQASGWSEMLSHMTFANISPLADTKANALLSSAVKAARTYSVNPHGWIIFAGTWGDGKTHLLAAIANAQPPRSVWLYTVARDLWAWLGCVRSPDETVDYEARMELVKSVDMLLLDELGAERSSEAVLERRQRLLDHRYRGGMATVFATNAWPLDTLYTGQGNDWQNGWVISRLQDRRRAQAYKMPDLDYRRSG
jgi:DNA replication protein DnaC